jgi:hypothetical protein
LTLHTADFCPNWELQVALVLEHAEQLDVTYVLSVKCPGCDADAEFRGVGVQQGAFLHRADCPVLRMSHLDDEPSDGSISEQIH